MALEQPFSKRNRYSGGPKEIAIRLEAPENLRDFMLETAVELGCGPSSLREIVCRVLRTPPNPRNWSDYPNVWEEVQQLVCGCDWFKVYDIVEAIYARTVKNDRNSGEHDAPQFSEALNGFFIEEGIGWQLVDGYIVTRGTEAFEAVVTEATA